MCLRASIWARSSPFLGLQKGGIIDHPSWNPSHFPADQSRKSENTILSLESRDNPLQDKCTLIEIFPIISNSPFLIFEVNLTSWSEITVLGIPWSLHIFFIKLYAMLIDLNVDLTWMWSFVNIIFYYHNWVMLLSSPCKSGSEIHGNSFSFPF